MKVKGGCAFTRSYYESRVQLDVLFWMRPNMKMLFQINNKRLNVLMKYMALCFLVFDLFKNIKSSTIRGSYFLRFSIEYAIRLLFGIIQNNVSNWLWNISYFVFYCVLIFFYSSFQWMFIFFFKSFNVVNTINEISMYRHMLMHTTMYVRLHFKFFLCSEKQTIFDRFF